MRKLYIVTYDISSPRRWRHVYKTMKGFGQHVQLSVFRCDLTEAEYIEMQAALVDQINTAEDQIILVDLGPSDGRAHRVQTLGRPTTTEERGARIL